MAKNSAAKIAANNRYQSKVYELVSFRTKRADRLNERINTAAAQQGTSRAAYLTAAITAALDRDGVTLDSLPAAPEDVGGD